MKDIERVLDQLVVSREMLARKPSSRMLIYLIEMAISEAKDETARQKKAVSRRI